MLNVIRWIKKEEKAISSQQPSIDQKMKWEKLLLLLLIKKDAVNDKYI